MMKFLAGACILAAVAASSAVAKDVGRNAHVTAGTGGRGDGYIPNLRILSRAELAKLDADIDKACKAELGRGARKPAMTACKARKAQERTRAGSFGPCDPLYCSGPGGDAY